MLRPSQCANVRLLSAVLSALPLSMQPLVPDTAPRA